MPPARTPSETTHFGFREVPLADKQALVDDVFHSVARRYDLMNDLMSGGLHRAWKDVLVTAVNPPKRRAAVRRCSTSPAAPATSRSAWSRRAAPATRGNRRRHQRRHARGRARARAERGLDDVVTFVEGNAEALPFPDRSLRRGDDRLRHPQRAAHRGGAGGSPSRAARSAGVSCALNSPASTCRGSTRSMISIPST